MQYLWGFQYFNNNICFVLLIDFKNSKNEYTYIYIKQPLLMIIKNLHLGYILNR